MSYTFHLFLALVLLIFVACSVNPVTGKRELTLVSTEQEIKIGEENYLSSRQSQGGDLTLDPQLTAYVQRVGQKLVKVSERADLPYEFVVLNSSVPNAWALPGGKIAINRGLLTELNSEAELAAVLGHEIVHAAARHSARSMERGTLMQVGVLGLGLAIGERDNAGLLVGAAQAGTALLGLKYGRDAELEADLYGMRYLSRAGYDPRAAISLQETFVKLAKGEKTNWLQGLLGSHPPSQERVETNRRTASQLPAGGFVGVEEYRKQLATVRAAQPAYAKLDAGRAALAKKDASRALQEADAAIALEPREALFYGLRGDALAHQQQYAAARAAYDQAIARNSQFFQFYLQRGLVRQKLNDMDARADLEKSITLLPTATAHAALGDLAAQRGDKRQAIEHYGYAAQSASDLGRAAARQLAKLELPENPQRYLDLRFALTQNGHVEMEVRNRAPLAVQRIAIQLAMLDARGVVVDSDTLYLAWTLQPNAAQRVKTRLQPLSSAKDLQRLRFKVESIEIAEKTAE